MASVFRSQERENQVKYVPKPPYLGGYLFNLTLAFLLSILQKQTVIDSILLALELLGGWEKESPSSFVKSIPLTYDVISHMTSVYSYDIIYNWVN